MSGDANPVFVDTNILVYATFGHFAQHTLARTFLETALADDVPLWISRQVMREFAMVVTRPQTFMQPVTVAAASGHLRTLIEILHVADEDRRVTARWLTLLETIPLAGRQVHDANIVATMQANQIDRLLTNNVDDFKRFAHLITIIPLVPSSTTQSQP